MERYSSYKDSGVSWIGDIPEHWEIKKIGSLFVERREKVSDKEYPALSVSKQGITPQLDTAVKTDNGDNRKKVCKNDFVVNSRSDRKGSCGVSPYTGSVSLINIVLSPRENIEVQYFHHLFRSNNYIEEYYRIGHGIVADLWTTRYSEMRNIYIPLPPSDEQRTIVDYIEDKTSKIDAYVADKEKEIELLQELKQKTIAEAVTKGLNPDVKMKEYNSLISSQCPEHWKIMRNKSFLSLTGEKVGNRANEHTLLSLTTKGVIVRDLESGKGKFPKDFDTYQIVKKDDLVFCLFDIDETPRTVGLVDTEGMITGAYTALKVNQSIALPEYVYCYYLCVDDIKALKPYYSGLRKTVRADKFLQLYLPLPPLDEQQAIVAYIEEKCQKIDTLITELQAEIDHLKEYKQRLIADVVTGQVNVQNVIV